ncbi:MAG TPA: trigger factor [Gammaproteobacteria bacterium]|jgi:trigger factor|nr:trigger factor [Gammaproteobacteria bacterium]MDP6732249.1 trigger factor [Gammaproteobacteria bacterium]HAJ76559.1 trigger factor [Gammaproteobacteria bacterium]
MQVSVETTEGLERKMTIAVPVEQVDTAVNARLQEAAKTVQLKGFRKGRVPFKLIKSKFGPGVRQEVVGELMNQSYYEALNQESLKPAGQPRIEATKLEEGEDLEFTAVFEVYPEIAIPDFSSIEVERLTAEIGAGDVDEMIDTLRQQRQTWSEVEREAADQDMVNIDYVGKKGGEEFDGGKAAGSTLVLGSERMIPGFEEGIVGKQAGDTFTLPLEFPKQYHNDELAGQSVEFDITLNSVSEQVLPEVDEEFIKSFGVEEGGEEAFREEITNNMTREMKTASRNKLKNKVMDALVSVVDIAVPDALIAGEVQQLRQQAMQQMGGAQKLDPSMLPDELFQENAKRRVVLGLVLGEVVQQQNLQADLVKVRESVEELASTYESPDDVINWYYSNKDELAGIESTVIEEQVFDYIIEAAQVSDKSASYQEIMKPEQRAENDSDDVEED